MLTQFASSIKAYFLFAPTFFPVFFNDCTSCFQSNSV
jgi:hypothetical protein